MQTMEVTKRVWFCQEHGYAGYDKLCECGIDIGWVTYLDDDIDE